MLISVIALALGLTALVLSVQTKRDIAKFINTTGVENLPKALKHHHLRQNELRAIMQTMNQNQSGLNRKLRTSLRRSGFVRFNPYHDTGGDQSFCLALLDDRKDGYILTAVHGREGTRVYAKRVIRGESDYKLSAEEMNALKEAISIK